MGYMRHHAIIVTSWHDGWIAEARAKADQIFGLDMVTNIVHSPVNGYKSFLIAPDGSKEGWLESEQGDAKRAEFISWLRAQAYPDGSSPLDWVEVQYGDDDGIAQIITHSREDTTP